MREASFILPLDVQWQESWSAHRWVKDQLLATFGGYTATHKSGAWRDPDTGQDYKDQSVDYVVAYETGNMLTAEAHMEQLRLIAHTAGKQCGQLAMYIKDFNGDVSIERIV